MTILRAQRSTNFAEEEILSNVSWSALNLFILTNHKSKKNPLIFLNLVMKQTEKRHGFNPPYKVKNKKSHFLHSNNVLLIELILAFSD